MMKTLTVSTASDLTPVLANKDSVETERAAQVSSKRLNDDTNRLADLY